MDKKELLKTYMTLVEFLMMHGEMIKGLQYLQNPPALIEEESEVLTALGKLQRHLGNLSKDQNNGKINVGFNMPNDIDKKVAFGMMRKSVVELGLGRILDVGCFSGWMGKALSLDGVHVHGIDVLPLVLQNAALYSTGSLATFEYCNAEKVGFLHPKQFDGAVLFDVIEHCFDPEVVLKSIKRSVRDGGWIFLNIPDAESESVGKRTHAGEFENDLEDLDMHEHLRTFTKKEIERLMEKEKNFNCQKINNELGGTNWYVIFQV